MHTANPKQLVVSKLLSAILVISVTAITIAGESAAQEGSANKFLNPNPVPRFALVVGAQYYEKLDKVSNAYNDASKIAGALAEAGGFSYIGYLPDPVSDQEILEHVVYLAQLAGS